VGGGLIPLVEELLKPLALWLLSPRLTPAEGFVAGLICGAAFALLETMGMLSAPVNDAWAGVVIGRLGTGLLHTVNTGLVGWGLAVAWSQERYMELGIIFLLAAGLHSIWNIFSILLGISPIFNLLGVDSGLMARLGTAAPITLGVLILTLYLLLAGFNQRLRSPADKTVAGPNLNPGV
jgi:RsiW-degrading membrane proteinase PrsW (M82 family)